MKSNKVFDITQPKDNWERGFAKMNYEWTGLRQVFNTKIPVQFFDDSCIISLDLPNDNHDECDDLPLTERCVDCIADFYDGKAQFDEDMYRER